MPAHHEVVSLRKAELSVGVGKPESSFTRFGRVPLEVISGGDAVEVLLQQIGMYAGDFKWSDRRANREEVSIGLKDRRQVRFDGRRRHECDLHIVYVERGQRLATRRLHVENERTVGQGHVIGSREPHPGVGGDVCISNYLMERRYRAGVTLQTNSQLRWRFARRQLGPQRNFVARAVEHYVGDVDGDAAESSRTAGNQETVGAAVRVSGGNCNSLIADTRSPALSRA